MSALGRKQTSACHSGGSANEDGQEEVEERAESHMFRAAAPKREATHTPASKRRCGSEADIRARLLRAARSSSVTVFRGSKEDQLDPLRAVNISVMTRRYFEEVARGDACFGVGIHHAHH